MERKEWVFLPFPRHLAIRGRTWSISISHEMPNELMGCKLERNVFIIFRYSSRRFSSCCFKFFMTSAPPIFHGHPLVESRGIARCTEHGGKVLKVVVLAGWNIMIHRPNEVPTTSWSQDGTCNVQHIDLYKNLLERNEIWLRADVFFDILPDLWFWFFGKAFQTNAGSMRIHWFLLRKELVKIVSTVGRNDSIPCFLQHTCNSVHLREKFLPMVVPLKNIQNMTMIWRGLSLFKLHQIR